MATGTSTPPVQKSAPVRAVDQSMSLLRDVTELSLDPGYRRAKAAEASGVSRPGRSSVGVILVIAVFLGCMTVWAIRELRVPAPVAAKNREALVTRVQDGTAQVKQLQASTEQLRAEIGALQRQVVDAPVSDRIDDLALDAGQTSVEGPGLRVTLHDAPPPADKDGIGNDPRDAGSQDDGRVLDRDLQIVVNALWAAGAEAIAVNGERLSALSAIRGAGDAVLVDFKPLIPPYEVTAIGNAARMQSGFAANGGGDYVQQLRDIIGINVSMAADDTLKLPAVGQASMMYAKRLYPAGSPGTGTSGSSETSTTSGSSNDSAPEENP